MHRTLILVLAPLTLPALAQAAGPDLVTTIQAPMSTHVYASARWEVTVDNAGNRHARDVELVIDLPETHTSPDVYLLGELGSYSSRCTASDTSLVCDLGRIRSGRSRTVSFDLMLPLSEGDLVIAAEASTTTSGEQNPADDADDTVAVLDTIDVGLQAPEDLTISHCTGGDLTSFFECELFPSSISGHETRLESDGSITFTVPSAPGYTGAWWSQADDHLAFEYVDGNSVTVLQFEGYGVDADCFEGVATFPPSPGWVAPYRVCR